jgi:hypothetical protein
MVAPFQEESLVVQSLNGNQESSQPRSRLLISASSVRRNREKKIENHL